MDDPTTTAPSTTPRQSTWNESFNQLDAYADQLRLKLPAAPPGLMEGYMRFAPWVAIVFGILGVLLMLVGLGVATFLAPLLAIFGGAAGLGYGGSLFIAVIVGLISAALEVVGGYLMLQRSVTGWWILAAGFVVSFLSNLVHGSVLTIILLLLIAYIHLAVKPNYR